MSAFPSTIDLAGFDPEFGFVIGFPATSGSLSASDAGDMNGDGYGDIIVGDTGDNRAYVIFGKAGGYAALDADAMAPGEGLVITDNSTDDDTGRSVSSLGDIDGDGLADIIIGAPRGDDGGESAGEAYVIHGSSSYPSAIDLTSLTPSQGFVIRGDAAGDGAGRSVSSAGDVNGDGLDDILIGAPFGDNGGNGAGEAYLLFGKSTGFSNIDLTFAFFNTDNGIVIRGAEDFDQAATIVSSAGDVNGDGFDDMLVSAPYNNDGGYYAGRIYVIFGKATGWAPIDLAALSAGDGFAIQGDAYDYLGFRVSEAGDINGDGFDDILVGSSAFSGEAHVVYGKAGGFGTIDLGSFTASQGFVIRGGDDFSSVGRSVSSAGDVNGDGHSDIIVGAFGNAFVIFGKDGGFGNIDVSNLAPEDGFRIAGEPGVSLGASISSAGDLNGDGFDDLIASAGGFGTDNAVYVIYGRGEGDGDFPLIYEASAIAPAFGGVIIGDASGDNAGSGLAAGDVNGDGYDDLLIGAPAKGANGAQSGSTWLLFGSAAGFGDLDLTSLGTDIGIRIDGAAASDRSGASVAAGDVNGDGLADIVIGARGAASYTGAVYVLFGKTAGWSAIGLGALAPTEGFTIVGDTASDNFGQSVSYAGDVNGDGFGDIIVGAPFGDDGGTTAGEAYLIFGKADGFGTIDVGAMTTADGFKIQGDTNGDQAGFSVASAGDVNGDGLDDLMVGAPLGDNAATNAGEAYILFGKASGLGDIDLTTLAPTEGFVVRGTNAADQAGWSVSDAGDFNGDGLDDLIIGAPYSDAGRSNGGAAYVVFGKVEGLANLDLGALAPADGFAIFGSANSDWAGRPVSNAGDVNGDGFEDILVGAIFGDTAALNRGDAYVVFGKASGFGTIDLSALTVDQGFVIANEGPGGIGLRVAAGGDVNGDGLDDILVGDPFSGDGGGNAGRVLVIHGRLPGNDVVRTGSAIGQMINGGRGEDELSGLGGADRLIGGSGDDILEGGTGNDRLFGEGGIDTARYTDAGAGVTVRLVLTTAQNTFGAGSDTLSSIENAIGSAFADSLAGTVGANRLEGGGGGDTLGGQGGEDVLIGGAGDDVLRGGGGDDEMRGGTGDDIYFVNDADDRAIEGVGQGHDQVKAFLDHVLADHIEELRLFGAAASGTGNGLDNAIFGSSIANTLSGLGGDDTLRGQSGVDELRGGDDADILYGALGNDRLFGDAGEDRMNGEDGVDFLSGGSGEDRLFGGGGADALHGGTGADALNGGIQRDTMTGNSGADQFVFADGDTAATRNGADIVTDFSQADGDRINLRQIDANANAGGDQNFTFVGDVAFSGAAGELRYAEAQGNTYIEGDTDGDGTADFMIRLDGLVEPVAGDFVL